MNRTVVDTADVIVVGAGAAGLATAIFAARRMPGRRVLVLDGARRPGAKILVAGGGRCNVTNRAVGPEDFSGGSRHVIRRVLEAFTVEQTVAFFEDIGVRLHEEEHGKLFPDSNRARTVLDALLAAAARAGARVLTDHRVDRVVRENDALVVHASAGCFRAPCVVLATGGRSLPKTGSDGTGYGIAESLGHSIVPTTPALVPLVLEGDFHRSLAGIAQEVRLTLTAAGRKPLRVAGSMLWTHFGVSGPAVLNVSRHWLRCRLEGVPATLTANLFPGFDVAGLEGELIAAAGRRPRAGLRAVLAERLAGRVAEAVLARLGIDGHLVMSHLPRQARGKLAEALTSWPLGVVDSRGYAHAEATAGGVPLSEVDPATMASRKCPGLFLAGEILDVDGRIGGFNFQWAWSTAYVAAAGVCIS